MMSAATFTEKQRFHQPFIWIILGGVGVLLIWATVQQLVFEKPFGPKPLPNAGLLVLTALYSGFLFLFSRIRLETRIDANGINYRFFPFHMQDRHINWAELEKAHIRTYKPIGEFGGWGMRYKLNRKSNALNISGNIGLQLVFKDKKELLIGTRRAEEMKAVVEKYFL